MLYVFKIRGYYFKSMEVKRINISQLLKLSIDRKIVALTSYTANIARITDNYADILLVGDSLGMVLYAMPSTQGVTLDMMKNHGRAVVNASKKAFVVIDMPFGSYEESPAQAFKNCCDVISFTNANAIKLEGGVEMSDTIRFLVDRGIPVMAHVGLMPQKYKIKGSFSKEKDGEKVMKDFESVVNAGAFSVVIENVPDEIADDTGRAFPDILTIGIGAGSGTKGQIAVFEDLAGLSGEYIPPFYKKIQNLAINIEEIAKTFADEVK
jgi:3-methyl-2-oxobutanoate hydroxymethyltransferase